MKTTSIFKVQVSAFVMSWACTVLPCAWAAGNIDATNKYSWGENAGWVNVAPTSGGVTVSFNGTSGYLTGFAWGENVGWIKFGDDTGGPYNNNSASDWGVNLTTASNLTGYAWGENVGWINFNPSYSAVVIDMATGQFSGDAWGENIGWLRFKGTSPDFNVRTLAFDKQAKGTPNWWLANYGVTESYDDGDGIPAWQEYMADTNPTNPASCFRITAVSNLPAAKLIFPSSSHRFYTLQSCSNLTAGVWTNIASQVGVQGNGGTFSLQDPGSVTRRFYRIRVAP